MTSINIDWKAIRPLNGKRHESFEELCAQLARASRPAGSSFVRKGTPDAGVECFAILDDEQEWGWQGKYFSELGESQWGQLDKSVKTALNKHPKLARYFVCVPCDRPDARIEGRKSALQRWEDHEKKWRDWASNLGMKVEFVFWGSHELLDILTKPEHGGRLQFFFGGRALDDAWFDARLEAAIRSAGPRYTPEIHLELPISRKLDTFARAEELFDRVRAQARPIRARLNDLSWVESRLEHGELADEASALCDQVDTVLTEFGAIESQPDGVLPFSAIAREARRAVEKGVILEAAIRDQETHQDPKRAETDVAPKGAGSKKVGRRQRRLCVAHLLDALRNAASELERACAIADSNLLMLDGVAGAGKTHLLCDVAKKHVNLGRPVVILMGQQFLGSEPPWSEALKQLDLAGLSIEEFVGALEACAQARNQRAIIVVDALNEGAGRHIWPNHLASFLAPVAKSQWIAVVISVRSTYAELIIPECIRAEATVLTHEGFLDLEYDATRTFFGFYGIELPTTPVLAPEFSNPLFLKTLCKGLSDEGDERLPRGWRGVTYVFDLYLRATNKVLASSLDYNPKNDLVGRAVTAIVKEFGTSGERWLAHDKVESITNALLPNRGFDTSLYRGLVDEGVLIERVAMQGVDQHEEEASLGYDRLIDHLVGKLLIDEHVNAQSPEAAFADGGALAYMRDGSRDVSAGILEALCILMPERTGSELIRVAPGIDRQWGFDRAFRQSVIWRLPDSCSTETVEVMRELTRNSRDWEETLDVMITVACLPDHPMNADYLDGILRDLTIADRDARWSIHLHNMSDTRCAVDRVIDWSCALLPDDPVDDRTVELCNTCLAWMLTCSNRVLRDRATHGLVSLLRGRESDLMIRFLDRFTRIDDPYLVERVYAVAYGAAMRNSDTIWVGEVGKHILKLVFADDVPAHILLRDYARGVVELGVRLGVEFGEDVKKARPPYESNWPEIPTLEELKALYITGEGSSYDSGGPDWSLAAIESSVMGGDFSRYIIGTNSSNSSWLSLTKDQPEWRSAHERLEELENTLPNDCCDPWLEWKTTDTAYRKKLSEERMVRALGDRLKDLVGPNEATGNSIEDELEALSKARNTARDALLNAAPEHRSTLLAEIIAETSGPDEGRLPPRFDLGLVQRYVLWRVLDLGWTTKSFGHFDRFSVRTVSREPPSAERIGKKYQWIAYHECVALIADNFQYLGRHGGYDTAVEFDGPWQEHLRDIDPSCPIRRTPGANMWSEHDESWWAEKTIDDWSEATSAHDWVQNWQVFAGVEELLRVHRPNDGTSWLNMHGHFHWEAKTPADASSSDVERRQIWLLPFAFLIRACEAQDWMSWSRTVDFWGRWMPSPQEEYQMFLGEHARTPASQFFEELDGPREVWIRPRSDCPGKLRRTTFAYLKENSGHDQSVEETFRLHLPDANLLRDLGLKWNGSAGDFEDPAGDIATFDPTAYEAGPTAMLMREDFLRSFLREQELTVLWVVLGEKAAFESGVRPETRESLRVSGAYVLDDDGPTGFLTCMLDEKGGQRSDALASPLAVIE